LSVPLRHRPFRTELSKNVFCVANVVYEHFFIGLPEREYEFVTGLQSLSLKEH
jgi:hypothetical protein